jgi:CheY-like chemotaxis protein
MDNMPVVLVVEDEPIVRMDAVQMLEDAGFTALEAGDAHQALVVLEGRCDICAVFSDINMPGAMDGLRLVQAVRRRWPPIQLVLTSGLVCPGPEELPVNGRFIRKPYDPDDVIATIRELLSLAPPAKAA